jgi:plastocyanin
MRSSPAVASCLAALALAGCGGDDGDSKAASEAKVNIASFAFNPDPVRVRAGGRVRFVNQDRAPHNAESPGAGFNTVRQETGDARTVALEKPGTYEYFCRFHRFMTGTIEVVG